MLSVKLDPELEQLLKHDVDDLARYNILRYLHDSPQVRGCVQHFSEELGLRSLTRTEEALEALSQSGLVVRLPDKEGGGFNYGLSTDPVKVELVDKLYRLSSSGWYGEIVEMLAARSLRRARKAQLAARAARRSSRLSA